MIMTRFNFRSFCRRKTRPSAPRPQERSRYAVQTYSRSDLRLITSPNHFFFPARGTNLLHLLTKPAMRYSPVRAVDNIQGLTTQKDLLSFDIYPTCPHSLSVNSILHQAAQNGSFDSSLLEKVLGVHILVLGLAPELHQFLSMTTKDEVDTAIVDFLVLLHHQLESEGDVDGVRRLEEDLEPTFSARLLDGIGVFPDGEPPPGRRADVLEQIVQLAFLTPWRVDVWGAYITQTELLDLRSGIIVSGDVTAAKMIKDWIVFSDVLQTVAPDWGIADGLERAICEKRSTEIFARARVVSSLVEDIKSVFHRMPRDVVEGCLIPWLVRKECEALPSKRRHVPPLECTPAGAKFLDELEAAGDDVINRLAVDRDGLSLWREWAAAYDTATKEEQDLCFSLDRKPWDRVSDNENITRLDGMDFGSMFSSRSEERANENSSWGLSFIRNRRFLGHFQ